MSSVSDSGQAPVDQGGGLYPVLPVKKRKEKPLPELIEEMFSK